MRRLLVISCALLGLSGCMCIPEAGETVFTTSYFSDCWAEASKQP
ncbi:MAG: hypothetical protein SFX19_07700 [Alphaproteobacteria bacterium]|nr:hypothetical protein [Alphaproteobacteria bacterium]